MLTSPEIPASFPIIPTAFSTVRHDFERKERPLSAPARTYIKNNILGRSISAPRAVASLLLSNSTKTYKLGRQHLATAEAETGVKLEILNTYLSFSGSLRPVHFPQPHLLSLPTLEFLAFAYTSLFKPLKVDQWALSRHKR